jgi:transcriptional regulator with XRE-family HTH domain
MTADDLSALRFKQLREDLKFTQAEFARLLDINTTSTADIERGKTKIPGLAVMEMMRQFDINPLWLYGKSDRKTTTAAKSDVSPAVVTVDEVGQDNIVMVNVKAAAGYPENIQDPSWYQQLPAFNIPLQEFRNASFRGFQVEGHSMMKLLRPNEWVIGRAIGGMDEIEDHSIYVVISRSSVLVKKVSRNKGRLELISENPEYPLQHMLYGDVQELWKVTSKLSFDLESGANALEDIQHELREIRHQLNHRND